MAEFISNRQIIQRYQIPYYYCAKGWRSGSSVFLKFQSYKVIKFKVKDNSKLESE